MAKSSRQLWKNYVEGRSTSSKGLMKDTGRVKLAKFHGVILGVDPSLRGTGIAIVCFEKEGRIVLRHRETIKIPPSQSSTQCLARISERCEWLVRNFEINQVAVEQTIYVQNYKTAMTLGAAKGAALGILAKEGLEVFEYPPLRIKQAIVGNGRASKQQVAEMVTRFTGNLDWSSSDETDAAGVALCHGFTYRIAQ